MQFEKTLDARELVVDTENQPKPGLIVQGLVDVVEVTNELKKTDSFWVYNDEEKSLTKKIGSKPGFWVYGDDDDDKSRNEDLSAEKLGAKPGWWVYNDDAKLKE